MNYGSEKIWYYSDCSDDEYVSEAELEEGMWLSQSDDDDDDDKATRTPGAAKVSKRKKREDLEGSKTKYLPPEDSSDSSDEAEDEPTLKSGRGSGDKGAGNYVDLDLPTGDGVVKSKQREAPVVYAEIPTVPPPPPVKVTPATVPCTPSSPPPLPPPPGPKGMMKNRLNSQRLRRMKKARKVHLQPSAGLNQRGRIVRKSDTNILAVKFNQLIEPSHVHTGDPVVCRNASCSAVLSHLSSVGSQKDKDEMLWVCEFCGERNEVDVVREELPTKMDTTFLISPAPTVEGGAGVGGAGVEEALVVFCIDISGSMCVTTEVPGKFELKGHDRVKDLASLNVNNEDQYMPRQRRDVTYVSRLQSVQAAVDHQLTELAKTNPLQRVALVTFNNEVTLVGDGKCEAVTMAGDKLWSADTIMKVGGDSPLPASLSITRKALSEKVFQLEESGQTALGPALLVSIALASRVPGSKVIICTDGLANKGVGNLDGLDSAENIVAAQTFYEDMGTLAVEKNVMVSLVRIKGTDCKAVELGQVADKTGGEVTIVDPLNITQEFSSILANPVIATNVRTKIVLHGKLYFRTEETHDDSMLVIPVGNVTTDTELTYEYGVRNRAKKSSATTGASPAPKLSPDSAVPPLTLEGKPHFPFQLQIEYTGRDGSRCLRVVSEAKPMTRDRKEAERDIRMDVVGTHVAHRTAHLAMEGEYTTARLNALSTQRLLQRTSKGSSDQHSRSQYVAMMEDIIPLETALRKKQTNERATFGHQYSDEEDEETNFLGANTKSPLAAFRSSASAAPTSKGKKKKAFSRRGEVEDDLATYCYNMKKHNYTPSPRDRPDDQPEDRPEE